MTPIDPRSDHPIARALPAEARDRIRTLRLEGGTVTLIADAAGLERGAAGKLQAALEQALGAVADVTEVRVALMADKVQRRIVAIGSGKGGVGKSTVAANLSIALARAGRRVGLVDADIYGPSQPRLMMAEGERPTARDQRLDPVPTPYGVPMLSMGQLVAAGKALAWRGPMIAGALTQLVDAPEYPSNRLYWS